MQLRDLVVRPAPGRDATQARATALAAIAVLRRGQPLESVMRNFGVTDSGRFMDAGHVDTGDIFQFAVRAKSDDAIYNAAVTLRDGEISDIVEEPDGMHFIAMIKHRFPVAQTFEQASDRVWTDVKNEAQARVRAANLAYLRGRADIIVTPEYAR